MRSVMVLNIPTAMYLPFAYRRRQRRRIQPKTARVPQADRRIREQKLVLTGASSLQGIREFMQLIDVGQV